MLQILAPVLIIVNYIVLSYTDPIIFLSVFFLPGGLVVAFFNVGKVFALFFLSKEFKVQFHQ